MDPFNDAILLSYFEEVARWHGYVRFLGLPHLEENPDQPLYELYVEPFLSRAPVSVDEREEGWLPRVEPVLKAVAGAPRLVLLGDPGSGKSTLVSWIAWQFSRPQANPWRDRLGAFVPLPLVLRDLQLGADLTWERLLDAFLEHPVARALKGGDRIEPLLSRGQALLLLDGLDEIGNEDVRRALRRAVFEGSARYPECRFLLTSRMVGYEQVPFFHVTKSQGLEPRPRTKKGTPDPRQPEPKVESWGELRYAAPFSDAQVEQFAGNWYRRREAARAQREQGAADLVQAIRGSESTRRLARNPNLLTLMALIHRVQRRLPHGRALLFEKIAEAYLESIDAFRGIQEVDYPLAQKKRWLARVAFQMQLRRGEAAGRPAASPGAEAKGRVVLADAGSVQRWILEAMATSGQGADRAAAAKFVDYIGRRSGLLLPRGEGVFAFTHLSFQEYFAAVYLADQVIFPRWESGRGRPGARPEDLRVYANQATWRETLVLLFELLADQPGWPEELCDHLFGPKLREVSSSAKDRSQQARAELLAEVSVDPYSGLPREMRSAAWKACWKWEMATQQKRDVYEVYPGVARRLLAAERSDLVEIWALFREVALRELPKRLQLSSTSIRDLFPLEGLSNLQWLDLSGTSVTDLTPLERLSSLQRLDLNRTSVTDLSPLEGLSSLQGLYLSETSVTDMSPLRGLSSLQSLDLSGTSVADLSPLKGLSSLQWLDLTGTPATDLGPVRHVTNIVRRSIVMPW